MVLNFHHGFAVMAQLLGILVAIESIPHGASKHVLRY